MEILNDLSAHYAFPIIFSTHPRTRKRLDDLGVETHKNIKFLKPFGFLIILNFRQRQKILSDSGTITEESHTKFSINIRVSGETRRF